MLNAASQRIARYLWWSPFRRPFEALARRGLRKAKTIQTGPLRGYRFNGGLAQLLGIYEPVIQRTLQELLKPGYVFYDVGANNGFFTLLAAVLVGSNGKVCSFEPLPENISRIERHLNLNRIANCQLVGKAVNSRTGQQDLFLSDSIATPTLVNHGAGTGVSILVETVALDDFVPSNGRPNCIKIDVEGAEADVLLGAATLLAGEPPPDLILEVHDSGSAKQVKMILSQAGYSIDDLPSFRKKHDVFPSHWLATRKAETTTSKGAF